MSLHFDVALSRFRIFGGAHQDTYKAFNGAPFRSSGNTVAVTQKLDQA